MMDRISNLYTLVKKFLQILIDLTLLAYSFWLGLA